MKYWQKLKEKWGVETDKRMTWIFVIFAITGTSTLFVRKFLYQLLGIEIDQPWLAIIVKIIAITLIYQVLLISIGTIGGERKFFTLFLKKMNMRFIGKKLEDSDKSIKE